MQAAGRWRRTSLEDLALIEGFAHVLEGPLPAEVLANQRLGLLAARIQLPPRVRLVVHLPVWAQLRRQSQVRSTWSGFIHQTLPHTCYFQLKPISSEPGNLAAPSCTPSQDLPECPWAQEVTRAGMTCPHPGLKTQPPPLHPPHRKGELLASEDPDSRNGAAVVGSKEDDTGKGILPQLVQPLEHS